MVHIIFMTNNIMTLGYAYANFMIKNPPNIFCQIDNISRLILWIP